MSAAEAQSGTKKGWLGLEIGKRPPSWCDPSRREGTKKKKSYVGAWKSWCAPTHARVSVADKHMVVSRLGWRLQSDRIPFLSCLGYRK